MELTLLTEAQPQDPALDIGIGHALLRSVAAGTHGAALRVFRPGATVAFGRLDVRASGFPAAVAAARAHGFTPVVRSAGGHAAAYDEASVVVEHVARQPGTAFRLGPRFEDQTRRLLAALAAVGAPATVGELPGEYCPGSYSIHLDGRLKVAGVAQRVMRDAAMTGAVVVVGHGAAVRAVITDVYAALGLALDPATAGSVDEVRPAAGDPAALAAAVADAYATDHVIVPGRLGPELVAEAGALADRHRVSDPASTPTARRRSDGSARPRRTSP